MSFALSLKVYTILWLMHPQPTTPGLCVIAIDGCNYDLLLDGKKTLVDRRLIMPIISNRDSKLLHSNKVLCRAVLFRFRSGVGGLPSSVFWRSFLGTDDRHDKQGTDVHDVTGTFCSLLPLLFFSSPPPAPPPHRLQLPLERERLIPSTD